ncbi:MAG: hypothetical protein ACRC62_16825 [Microcoleus sp.]
MFTRSIEKYPASRSLAFGDFSFHDSSFYGDWFVVSTIVPLIRAIALNSPAGGVELNIPHLLQNASIFGKIDSSKFVCQDSPGKLELGFAVYHQPQLEHQLKLQISQFPKWYSFLTNNTDFACNSCDRDRDCQMVTRRGSNFVQLLKSHLRRCLIRFRTASGSSKIPPADRNSDTIFQGNRHDRLFDYNTAIVN